MARKTALTSLSHISEINLTPLMDLSFILLITFVITFPLMEQGVSINLPAGDAAPLPEEPARTISINREGDVFLDDDPIDHAALVEALHALKRADPSTRILLRADEDLRYKHVVELLTLLHKASLTRVALVTQPADPS